MKRRILLCAALGLAAAFAGPAAARPPEELRCILDGASPQVREQVGVALWDIMADDTSNAVAALLESAADACIRRHGWSHAELDQVTQYTLGSAATRYIGARLAAIGIPLDRWEAIYAAIPPEERTRPASDLLSQRAIALMNAEPATRRDPDFLRHLATYFEMRIAAERAERQWTGLPVSQ